MGVLTENPPSGGLLADLLARLMATREPQPSNMLPSWKEWSDKVGELPRAKVDPLPEMAPELQPTNMLPSWKEFSDRAGPLPKARVDVPPDFTSAAQNALSQYVDQPAMGSPPMPSAPPPGAPPAPMLAQQGPMGGIMSAPNVPRSFPIPPQKPPQPVQATALTGKPIVSPGLGGHAKKKPAAVAKAALSESDLLNLQQLFPNMNRQQIAALWARRQAAG